MVCARLGGNEGLHCGVSLTFFDRAQPDAVSVHRKSALRG
jgi:hypothetical protein